MIKDDAGKAGIIAAANGDTPDSPLVENTPLKIPASPLQAHLTALTHQPVSEFVAIVIGSMMYHTDLSQAVQHVAAASLEVSVTHP